MFDFILNLFNNIIRVIFNMFGFKSLPPPANAMQVFVKTNLGEQVCVNLNPSLTVGELKTEVATKLNSSVNHLKLIFAGKELPDSLVIKECDIGNRSILHAIRLENIGGSVSEVTEKKLLKNIRSTASISDEANCANSAQKCEPSCSTISEVSLEVDLSRETINKKLPRLLCDPSTVLNIQLSERELKELQKLKACETERPHFYVYCTVPCSSVQIGKLRVRCQQCKSGAITLHSDPSNWNDVLQPHQISGTCESPNCGGKFAEFFFKCGHHETTGEDDTAVVLYLLRANLPGVPCLACTDVSSPIVVFECASAHVTCLDCFVIYCISRLNERQFVQSDDLGYTLPCPVGCADSLVKEVHHFKLMGNQQYERYQIFGAEEAVLAAGGVLCPKPGCGQGIIPDPECRRVKCLNGCDYVFCKDCLQGFHIGECLTDSHYGYEANIDSSSGGLTLYPSRVAMSNWDEASSITIRVTTKPCPKCRTPTERDGGCMHIVCIRSSCQFNWCWVCQTEWTRDCMSAHWFG